MRGQASSSGRPPGGLPEPPTRRARRRPEPPRTQRHRPSGAVSRGGGAAHHPRRGLDFFTTSRGTRAGRHTLHLGTLSLLVAKQRHAATSPNTNIHSSHHQRPAGCQKVTGLISCRRLRGWWAGTASRTRNSTAERQAKSVQASGRSGTPGLTTPRTPLRTPFARARTRGPLRGPSPRAPRGHFSCSTDEGRPVTTTRLGCTGRRW